MRAPVLRRDSAQEPRKGAALTGMQHGDYRNDAGKDAGKQNGDFDDRPPGEAVLLPVLVAGERERAERKGQQDAVARDILQLERGTVDLEADAGLPAGREQDRPDHADHEQQVDAAAYAQIEWRRAFPDRRHQAVLAVVPEVDREEDGKHERADKGSGSPQVEGRPEEIDAVQEADEQRRIAERCERAADIADQEDEEDYDVRVVEARRVGAH